MKKKRKSITPVYIDIMLEDGTHYCQLKYIASAKKGKGLPSYDRRAIEKFIFEKRPSLKYKRFTIEFSDKETEKVRKMKNLTQFNKQIYNQKLKE